MRFQNTFSGVIRKFFLNFIFVVGCCLPLNGFELKRVILSTNNNPLYIEFWPIVAPIWKSMGLQPTLALIANEDCPVDVSVGDIIRLTPIQGIPESLQAQVIRLFLPSFFPDEGCLISDIDMIPISHSYFINGAAHCPENGFLVYRDRAHEGTRYPMCYVAAKGEIFSSIFKISHTDEIITKMQQWADLGLGWNTDELLLYESVNEWEKEGGLVVRLGHEVEARLDRGNWKIDFSTLDISQYIDCHCPRPYSAFKDSIDQVVNAIKNSISICRTDQER